MKKGLLLMSTWILSSISIFSYAQNLVPNHSFEVQDTCPLVSQILLAPPWNSPTSGTPDLFNSTCATQSLSAHTGVGSSGVFCYNSFPDNREYIQAPLNSSLVGGVSYCVSFWVKRVNYRYATNQIGAFLSNGPINVSSTSYLQVTPQVGNNPNNMLSGSSWIQISGNFVASGGESHIIIGSFSTDAQTDTLVANAANTNKVSFYSIDDVSVVQCGLGVDDNVLDNQLSLFPSPSSSIVTIRNATNQTITSCQLFDLSGKIVLEVPVHNLTDDLTFNVDQIQNGSYLVKMLVGDKWITKKMLVVH
jgi:Secretion system C-terminal sorting domain